MPALLLAGPGNMRFSYLVCVSLALEWNAAADHCLPTLVVVGSRLPHPRNDGRPESTGERHDESVHNIYPRVREAMTYAETTID